MKPLIFAFIVIGVTAASSHYSGEDHYEEHNQHHHPNYEFDYGVHDLNSGDVKKHWETRDGDVVKGAYTIKEPNGGERLVEYHSDDIHGFNAVVKHIGGTYNSGFTDAGSYETNENQNYPNFYTNENGAYSYYY